MRCANTAVTETQLGMLSLDIVVGLFTVTYSFITLLKFLICIIFM